MLPDRDRQLLSAFVDGELSSRQRRHVERLLRRSGEARTLLRRLQEDARELRHLPRRRPPQDLSVAVLKAIAERRLLPGGRHPPRRLPGGFPPWAGLAAAAAVLFVIGAASYLYFSASLQGPAPPPLVKDSRDPETRPPDESPGPGPVAVEGGGPIGQPEPDDPPAPGEEPGAVPAPVPKPLAPRPGPGPVRPPKDVNVSPSTERFNPAVIRVPLPEVLKLRDLEQEAGRGRLAQQLRGHDAFRVELPCANGKGAFRRLEAVCKAQRIGLVIEAAAQARLKKPQGVVHYTLFAEDLTPAELVRLLRAVAAAEKRGAERKPPDARFNGPLVVAPLSEGDRQQLSGLLGVDPVRTRAERIPSPVEPGGAGQGAPRPPEAKSALVLAVSPVRSPTVPPEVKHFVDGRKPVRPRTLQVLLVLRVVGG
jgi:hypothetical protein